ncbi:MAG: alpha/beta fold hydrolase [Gemmatimonadaceae bacterium]
MKRAHRNLLAALAGFFILAYSGIVGLLAVSENSMVYASAGEGKRGRTVPGDDAGIPWDTLRVRAADSVPVFLLRSVVDAAPTRLWAIFFHGNAGMVGSRGNVARYQLLRDAGFNVLAVEYRGYGASVGAGPASEDGIYEDARAALAYLTDSLGVERSRVVAYGWSLGSGPATRLAAEAPLAALVTEGAFTSLPDVGAESYPWAPVRLVMRNRFDNVGLARRLTMPWLVLHGTKDREIPFAHGEALVAAASAARLVPLDADHGDGAIGDRAVALEALRSLAARISAPSRE